MKLGTRQVRMLRLLAREHKPMQLRVLAAHFGGIVRALQIVKSLEDRGLVDRDFFSWSLNAAGRKELEFTYRQKNISHG